MKLCEVTDDTLDDLYRLLETAPCPTNKGKPLGAKSVRHIHNILSGALGAAVPKLIPANPAATAHPPTARETHHCLRDAPLWTVYAATGVRRSEALGMKWSLVHWEEGAIELGWFVVEEGNTYRLRKLTKDGDDNALIYVDQSVMNVLKWQEERQDAERARLGSAWVDHDLVFARDGFKLYRGEAGGPRTRRRCLHGGAPCAPACTCRRPSGFTTGGTARSRTIWRPGRTP
ncbi:MULTISPECIES: hypothetical protein [unclassified Streptomyces]|uniref:hypothetical protein n=1 Tax=unclassified Streptomyces TaxID=2593676 RepID=UPI004042470F